MICEDPCAIILEVVVSGFPNFYDALSNLLDYCVED